MKKNYLLLALLLSTTTLTTLTYAATDDKSQRYIAPIGVSSPSKEVVENNKYMKAVLKSVPDMQEKNKKSKERSLKEGAALQVVSSSVQFYRTGLIPQSLANLINVESRGVKKFFKEKNIKGYFFINHDVLISKGYPKLEKEELDRFKSQANCKNGYCTVAVVTNLKLLDSHGKEQEFSRRDLAQYIKNEDTKNESLEINPDLIKVQYEIAPLNLVLGYGLGGNDALEFFIPKK